MNGSLTVADCRRISLKIIPPSIDKRNPEPFINGEHFNMGGILANTTYTSTPSHYNRSL